MPEFKIEFSFLVKVTRINKHDDTIDYSFGPSPHIDELFDRLLAFIKTESITSEYKEQLVAGLTRCSVQLADPNFDANPFLVSFVCTDSIKGYSDVYTVEAL